MNTRKYPLFLQTWFPSVGVVNKAGEVQDKNVLRWAYQQIVEWNQRDWPFEDIQPQKATQNGYCLMGWIRIVQGQEDFGRSYKEIRAVLFDEQAC